MVAEDSMELAQECAAKSPSYAQISSARRTSGTVACPQTISALRCRWIWETPWPQGNLGKSQVSLVKQQQNHFRLVQLLHMALATSTSLHQTYTQLSSCPVASQWIMITSSQKDPQQLKWLVKQTQVCPPPPPLYSCPHIGDYPTPIF